MTETPETYDIILTDDEKKRILKENMDESERKLWLDIRQALLGIVATIENEKLSDLTPTAKWKKIAKGKK